MTNTNTNPNTNPNNFNIRPFNPDCLTRGGITAVIIGRGAVGKTHLITEDLLPRIGSICQERKIVISPTAEFDGSYSSQIVDPQMFHNQLTPDLLNQIVSGLRNRRGDQTQTLLVMDDCQFNHQIVNDRNLRILFMNGRNLGANMLITQQYPMDLPPDFRANVDYIFIFRENNPQTRRKLYDYYAGIFPTFYQFCQVLDACTNNYGCLVIYQTSHSDRLEDQVFYYRAQNFDPRIKAVTVIANQWRKIQAKRQLARLRIGFELKLLPGVGIKYQEAAERFKQVQSEENQFYD